MDGRVELTPFPASLLPPSRFGRVPIWSIALCNKVWGMIGMPAMPSSHICAGECGSCCNLTTYGAAAVPNACLLQRFGCPPQGPLLRLLPNSSSV